MACINIPSTFVKIPGETAHSVKGAPIKVGSPFMTPLCMAAK